MNGAVNGLKQFLTRYIKIRVNFDLNKKIFDYLESFSLRYFQNHSTGTHLYKISYDAERATDFITIIPAQAIYIFPKMILLLGIIFYLNVKMAFLSVFLAICLYLPTYYYYTEKMRRFWKALIKSSEIIFKKLQEEFSHIELIKTFGKETQSRKEYLRLLTKNTRIKIRNTKLEIINGFIFSFIDKGITSLIVFYGGYQVIKGEISLGSLTAILVYLTQLIGLQSQFAHFFQRSASGVISCQRLDGILDKKVEISTKMGIKKVKFKKGNIFFKNVSFGYEENRPLFKNLTFEIKENCFVAITGASGTGKTTLLYLLLGIYQPWEGEISIDGYKIEELNSEYLREQIGMVLQKSLLLNDTVENNIKYAKKDADFKEITWVSKICEVDEFVRDLPLGYKTIIGENGCKLSEGQKQKIAIARALIKNPKILIFDEAFSCMDFESEERIIENIKRNLKDITLIVVSHRLPTLLKADLVYFLNDSGKFDIVKKEELLKKNSMFCQRE